MILTDDETNGTRVYGPLLGLRSEDRLIFTPNGQTHGNVSFNRFDPRKIGKQPTVLELQKPMKIDLPKTPIEMIGKTIGDEIHEISKKLQVEILSFSVKKKPEEAEHVDVNTKTHCIEAEIMAFIGQNSTQSVMRTPILEMIIDRFIYDKAKSLSVLPCLEQVEMNITYR